MARACAGADRARDHGASTARSASSREPTRLVEAVKLRIMQPNLPQDAKFNYGARAEVMRKYLALSDRATGPQSSGVRDATILIWPESAFPFFLAREADAMAQIANLLPQGTILITGAVRPPDSAPPGQPVTPRLQFDLCDRSRRHDPVDLRQAASGAVRRVSAVPVGAGEARLHAAHQGAGRIHSRHAAQPDRTCRARRACCR